MFFTGINSEISREYRIVGYCGLRVKRVKTILADSEIEVTAGFKWHGFSPDQLCPSEGVNNVLRSPMKYLLT